MAEVIFVERLAIKQNENPLLAGYLILFKGLPLDSVALNEGFPQNIYEYLR